MNTTPFCLLQRLRQPSEQVAWSRFVELYTPLLLFWAKRAGLQSEDAADLVQDVFVVLIAKLPTFEYSPNLSFRSWLRTVTMNRFRDRLKLRGTRPLPAADGLSGIHDEKSDESLSAVEHRQYLVRRALEVMKSDFETVTWRACWEMVVEGRSGAETARLLNLTENAVYLAKSRVLRRLRKELEGLLE